MAKNSCIYGQSQAAGIEIYFLQNRLSLLNGDEDSDEEQLEG